jgi:ribosomal-protein-alanine N-acetyltransferase
VCSEPPNTPPGSAEGGDPRLVRSDLSRAGEVRLAELSADAMRALLGGDLQSASMIAGVALTPYFLDHDWLWEMRLEQLERDPSGATWIARAALMDGLVIGHVGFHGPPDDQGVVEVAYSVDPRYRDRGAGRALLETALTWARRTQVVTAVRASISPHNLASLAVIKGRGFVLVDLVDDPEDGPELVFTLDLARAERR